MSICGHNTCNTWSRHDLLRSESLDCDVNDGTFWKNISTVFKEKFQRLVGNCDNYINRAVYILALEIITQCNRLFVFWKSIRLKVLWIIFNLFCTRRFQNSLKVLIECDIAWIVFVVPVKHKNSLRFFSTLRAPHHTQ